MVVASDNGTARFIENDGFKEIDRTERSVPLTSVALSEDGKALAIGGTVHLELWELRGVEEASPLGSLTEVLVLPVTDGHLYVGGSLAFSPDKTRLLGIAGSAVIWNAGSRKVEERLPPGESCCSYMPSISAAAFHPTGRAIVTTGNTGVYL